MKIRHIYDCAGVGNLLAYQQNKMGHDSFCVTCEEDDGFGFCEFYGGHKLPAKEFFTSTFMKPLLLNSDVIHVHFQKQVVKDLRKMFPDKKIFMHWHGTDARESDKNDIQEVRDATNGMFVATTDLLQIVPDAKWIPTPIDNELFHPRGVGEGDVAIIRGVFDYESIIEEYNRRKIAPLIFQRETLNVKCHQMPDVLRRYRRYIDIKISKGAKIINHSKTALEALNMGLTVLGWDGEFKTMPEQHRVKKVVRGINYKA